ncbi:hypothetical protein [Candidatus Halocynthiibacter alkanivorans]|uniref:hypothetical protein n=1 Tax=Candidatus Halocynthiibacter alkanivorans TaxID=2267619 RepID=UPI000DF180F0|nr:hypothetical protein [Candidatus Halocynthiibacter alkanivorans]
MTACSADGLESVKTARNNNDVAAAVLARQIKTRIEETMVPRLGELVAFAARLRFSAAQHVASERRRGL